MKPRNLEPLEKVKEEDDIEDIQNIDVEEPVENHFLEELPEDIDEGVSVNNMMSFNSIKQSKSFK